MSSFSYYYVPDYRVSNSNIGSFMQPVGPFPPSSAVGYGRPGGLGVNMLQNRPLAEEKGFVRVHELIPTDAATMWAMHSPHVDYVHHTLGAVSATPDGYMTYDQTPEGQNRARSYGRYHRG